MPRVPTPAQVARYEYGPKARIPKRPLYEFGGEYPPPPKDGAGLMLGFYTSDFGQHMLRGRTLEKALGDHRRLKKPPKRGRKCYKNCGPCKAEPAFNQFLKILWVAGGVLTEMKAEG